MPKVTEQHIEARRSQILAAAEACFARDGFHHTSMQDICREAQLSPGAVYRYFASKEEIIRAMADESLVRIGALAVTVKDRGDTLQVLDALADVSFSKLDDPEMVAKCSMDIEIWGEALRNPRVMEIQRQIIDRLRLHFLQIVREGQRRGELTRSVDAEAVVRLMISAWYGLLVQKAADRSVDTKKYVKALKRMMAGLYVRGQKREGGNGDVRVGP